MTSLELSQPKLPRLALTPSEAAEATGFRKGRICEAIRKEELVARRHGRALIIELAELQRWLRLLPTCGRQPSTTDDVVRSVEVPA